MHCGLTATKFPLCYCVTSVDEVTTCTSFFANLDVQTANCETDQDCTGLLGPGPGLIELAGGSDVILLKLLDPDQVGFGTVAAGSLWFVGGFNGGADTFLYRFPLPAQG